MEVSDKNSQAEEGRPRTVEGDRRPLWAGNINVYWLANTILGSWFLFVHSPMHYNKHAPYVNAWEFALHLAPAYFIYLVCMWNSFHTPSHGSIYRTLHIWLGRAALVLGPAMYLFGLLRAWNPIYNTPKSLAIGLTSGGAAHMICSFCGYLAIRKWQSMDQESDPKKKATMLKLHIMGMLGIFLPSCGTPALMRLGQIFGINMTIGLSIFIPVLILLAFPMERAISTKRWI